MSLLLHRPGAETPSDESVELPSRNQSHAFARAPLICGTEPLAGLDS
jgi:hypothetical protein